MWKGTVSCVRKLCPFESKFRVKTETVIFLFKWVGLGIKGTDFTSLMMDVLNISEFPQLHEFIKLVTDHVSSVDDLPSKMK